MSAVIRRTIITALAIAAIGQVAGAQQPVTGPRWQGWVGCWTAVANAGAWDSNNGPPATVCVAPTSEATAVDVVTLVDNKVVGRNRIDANGQPHPLSAGGCTGSEQARFSTDGRRVFMRSMVDCQGAKTETSALLAITATGDWIDVRSVASGGASNVRVARYRETTVPASVPADLTAAMTNRGLGAAGARIASSAPFSNDAIIEASKFVDAGVVQGWIMESGQRFAVDAWSLMQLADAGVPGQITDAMVQVSNPRQAHSTTVYASNGRYATPYGRGASDWWDQDTGERIIVYSYPAYDPWGFGWGFGYPLGYYPGYGRSYSYGRGLSYTVGLGWGYGFGYGYGAGYNTRGVGYYYPPVIVLHQTNGGGYDHGKATKGEGYSAGPQGAPSTPATPGTLAGTAGSTGAQVPTAGASSTSSQSPAKAASSSGRTAKGRP